jgi:hypothetical protein
MSKPQKPVCAKCVTKICQAKDGALTRPDMEKVPDFCPMKLNEEAFQKAAKEYLKEDVRHFAQQASIQEFQC